MPERDANQLAADVRFEYEYLFGRTHPGYRGDPLADSRAKFDTALDELVGLVGTLQHRLDQEIARAENLRGRLGTRDDAIETLDELQERFRGMLEDALRRADELEAQVGTLQQERDEAWPMGTPGAERLVYWYRRAEAAEAALAWKDAALTNMTGWHNEAQAALAEARETVANLCTRPGTCLADTGGTDPGLCDDCFDNGCDDPAACTCSCHTGGDTA